MTLDHISVASQDNTKLIDDLATYTKYLYILHPIDGLAIDWLTNKLYWSEATPETISVLDLERGHRLTLFSLPQSSIPRGIALDPMNG